MNPTYTNPLSLPDLPRGTDPPFYGMYNGTIPDYRSVSDPSLMLYDGKWYLYPSYGMTYVSEDCLNWTYVPSNIPSEPGYSPSVIHHNGKFYMTRHSDGLYSSDQPTGPFAYLGEFLMLDGTKLKPVDPALFADDDGRVYMYYFGMEGSPETGGSSYTLAVELDAKDLRRALTAPVIINRFDTTHEWERFGRFNQDARWGWIEGQWMLKHQGRYYLVYAANGTEFPSYAMGAYYSDEGPLSGFVYQKRNPIVFKDSGLVRGSGHGSIGPAPDGSLWVFYTMTVAYHHMFERRIGMDRILVDENGEIYCPKVTETPQYAPMCMQQGDAGLKPLTFFQRFHHAASSQTEGHEAFYALDDSMLTHWLPAETDPMPTLTVDMGAVYRVAASRVIWRDVGLHYAQGILPGPYAYCLDISLDNHSWTTALDCRDNVRDLNVDYRTFEPMTGRYVRLVVHGWPEGIRPGVVSFTAFGVRE